MMGVNTIFHWRFTGKSDVPSVRLRVSAVPDRTVAGRRSVWGEDSADCLETTGVSMLCNRPAVDVSDTFTSHLPISVSWGGDCEPVESAIQLQIFYKMFFRLNHLFATKKAQLLGFSGWQLFSHILSAGKFPRIKRFHFLSVTTSN